MLESNGGAHSGVKMRVSEFFFKIGGSAWVLGIGVSAIVLILGWSKAIQVSEFPWRTFLLTTGVGGLAAMIVGGVFAIWEENY